MLDARPALRSVMPQVQHARREPVMTNQETSDVGVGTRRSAEEIRAEIYRMLDELGSTRSLNAGKLQQRFDELWKQLGGDEAQTLH
jgi:hypothetical protein